MTHKDFQIFQEQAQKKTQEKKDFGSLVRKAVFVCVLKLEVEVNKI